MPRTAHQILAQANELAKRFEDFDPGVEAGIDAHALREIRHAFARRAEAEREINEAVAVARADGHSWATIGAMLGTSGEAARQRYGQLSKA
jgi:tellurite resistance protein